MIDYELFCKIRHLKERDGLCPAQIAQELALDARTVAKWIACERFCQRKPTVRESKLDPFKADITRLLERYPYSAAQLLQRLREQGFDGGYTIVKDYVRKVRPAKTKAYLTLSFAPGDCAQVDWGCYGSVNVGGTCRRLSFFVMVLCYSRMLYVEFTLSQTLEHFLACHQNAFEFFGAVPGRVMLDNLKSAVLKRIVGRAPVFNPKYLDFARHYGFDITACNVGRGNEKGRVENAVGYVKKNLLAGLDIADFASLAPAARLWTDTVANVRIHGETRKKPFELFENERAFLSALPANRFDVAAVSQARASSQFRIRFDGNRYSVPAEHAGAALTLKAYPDRLCIYRENNLVARHQRSYDRGCDFEDPDHPKALLAQRKSRPVLPQARRTPHEPRPPCAKDRGLKRDLRNRAGRSGNRGRLFLRGLLLGVHRQPARAASALPQRARRPSPDQKRGSSRHQPAKPRPVGLRKARRRR
jgi:transposase